MNISATRQITHPGSGAALRVPSAWDVILDPQPEIALVALEPVSSEPSAFRANLTLTNSNLNGMSFRDWQSSSDQVFPEILSEYYLIDLERVTFAQTPGGRRLVHYASPQGHAITLEQWFTRIDDIGHTLSATVDSLRYAASADLFAALAGTVELVSPPPFVDHAPPSATRHQEHHRLQPKQQEC
jgi:hypothetical protein